MTRALDDRMRILKRRLIADGVELIISGQENPLALPADTDYHDSLKEGIVLTAPQLQRLKEKSELFRCDREAARILALRDHSVGEFRDRLLRKRFAPSAVDRTTKKYRQLGALDDARYANAVAEALLQRLPCGQAYLTSYLQKKRIARTLAEQAAQLLLSGRDPAAMAEEALARRWSSFGQFELEKARRRAYNYLARRGFSYDDARIAFENLWTQKQEESEN